MLKASEAYTIYSNSEVNRKNSIAEKVMPEIYAEIDDRIRDQSMKGERRICVRMTVLWNGWRYASNLDRKIVRNEIMSELTLSGYNCTFSKMNDEEFCVIDWYKPQDVSGYKRKKLAGSARCLEMTKMFNNNGDASIGMTVLFVVMSIAVDFLICAGNVLLLSYAFGFTFSWTIAFAVYSALCYLWLSLTSVIRSMIEVDET